MIEISSIKKRKVSTEIDSCFKTAFHEHKTRKNEGYSYSVGIM